MSDVPDELKYTAEHEWVRPGDGDTVRVGITDYAQEALGDVVYVSLPEVGATVSAGAAIGEIESTKSVSDLYAPLSGTVTARNDDAGRQPGTDQLRPVRRRAGSSRSRSARTPSGQICWTPRPTALSRRLRACREARRLLRSEL